MVEGGFVHQIINYLITFSTTYLIPTMFIAFGFAVILRWFAFYSLRRESYFVSEFAKRVREYYSPRNKKETNPSFYLATRALLILAYDDVFHKRRKFMRRRHDYVESFADRVFVVEEGVKKLINGTLNQLKYLKKDSRDPQIINISKSVFETNPVFNKILGILPLELANNLLNILGIFGTFLGIMKALPELGGMSLGDAQGTKEVMDIFLLKISFSMSTSIVGILLSVAMTIVNTIFGPESLFYRLINSYTDNLNLIWNESETNEIPMKRTNFDQTMVVNTQGKPTKRVA
jgi:hypothetical protein